MLAAPAPPSGAPHRILTVLPGLPERRTGGGVILYELVAFLATRGTVAVVMPVADVRRSTLDVLRADPTFRGGDKTVAWHPLGERREPGLSGYVRRAVGRLPSDAAKVATEENRAVLERVRAEFRPTVELAVSSWALAPYRGLTFPEGARLFMVNVDPDIVRQSLPAVASPSAIVAALVRKLACAIDRPKVERLCRRALATAGRVGAISPADVAPLGVLGGRSDVVNVPPLMRPRPVDRSRAAAGSVLITTNFAYSPNVESLAWFLSRVWPHVDPAARLTVAGADDQGQLATLCRRHERVVHAGCLEPAALDAAFAEAAVVVNPTRSGSGFQVKLLDAVARGVPVVSTRFSNKLGPVIPSSDDPHEFAALINARLHPDSGPVFDYDAFHAAAVAAWDAFLFA